MRHFPLLFVTIMVSNNPGYELISQNEIQHLLNLDSRLLNQWDYQLPTNHAFVYALSNGKIILRPNTPDTSCQGMLFYNKISFDLMVATGVYPIRCPSTEIWDVDSLNLKDLPRNMYNFMNKLNSAYKLEFNKADHESLLRYFELLTSDSSVDQIDIISFSILYGEYIRQKVGGKWALIPKYNTYNQYYEPVITTNDKSVYKINMANHLRPGSNLDSLINKTTKLFIKNYADTLIILE